MLGRWRHNALLFPGVEHLKSLVPRVLYLDQENLLSQLVLVQADLWQENNAAHAEGMRGEEGL